MSNTAWYLLWPFGKFVVKKISETEMNSENYEFLQNKTKLDKLEVLKQIWNDGLTRVSFSMFLLILAPFHLLISLACFFFIFFVPMAKLNYVLFKNLLECPLNLSFYSYKQLMESPHLSSLLARLELESQKTEYSEQNQRKSFINKFRPFSVVISDPNDLIKRFNENISMSLDNEDNLNRMIILSIRQSAGLRYYKYTIDGVNIAYINFLWLVIFTIVDFHYIGPKYGFEGIASNSLIFCTGLLSIIPLAYFIGMAVSSITAQTGSFAIGAFINATFGSIVELLLYVFALQNGKQDIVEGSLIGSFLCGLLLLPGLSMFSGGVVFKERSFNSKSAGITSTLLIMALIGAFTPSIYQDLYGSFSLNCESCNQIPNNCTGCKMLRIHPNNDPLYKSHTLPLIYFCASALFLAYAIGMLYTLLTHSKNIYPKEETKNDPKKRYDKHVIKQMIKKEIKIQKEKDQNLRISKRGKSKSDSLDNFTIKTLFNDHEKNSLTTENESKSSSFSRKENYNVFELETDSILQSHDDCTSIRSKSNLHNHPNWGTMKSSIVLLFSTILFSLIAEILITCIDQVLLEYKSVNEKVLGLLLFSIFPSISEICIIF